MVLRVWAAEAQAAPPWVCHVLSNKGSNPGAKAAPRCVPCCASVNYLVTITCPLLFSPHLVSRPGRQQMHDDFADDEYVTPLQPLPPPQPRRKYVCAHCRRLGRLSSSGCTLALTDTLRAYVVCVCVGGRQKAGPTSRRPSRISTGGPTLRRRMPSRARRTSPAKPSLSSAAAAAPAASCTRSVRPSVLPLPLALVPSEQMRMPYDSSASYGRVEDGALVVAAEGLLDRQCRQQLVEHVLRRTASPDGIGERHILRLQWREARSAGAQNHAVATLARTTNRTRHGVGMGVGQWRSHCWVWWYCCRR